MIEFWVRKNRDSGRGKLYAARSGKVNVLGAIFGYWSDF
jgi:hypothetical protein